MQVLEDVKVLDFSDKYAGSLATMYLADYGAEVINVEPKEGSFFRSWGPFKNGKSLTDNYLNSGKKSITVDIETREGQELIKKILPEFDVVSTTFSKDYMEKIGLSYETLREIKEDIIYAACTDFGYQGTDINRPSSSLIVQARGVAMDMSGFEEGLPVQCAPAVAEQYSAGFLATSIVMAVIDKYKRGIGQQIDISMQDAIFSAIETAPVCASLTGEILTRKDNFEMSCAPYDSFKTTDGYVAIGVATDSQWFKCCQAMGWEDLKNDEKFSDNEKRTKDYKNVLRPLVAERVMGLKKGDVVDKLSKEGVPCSIVTNIAEVTDMENTKLNNYLVEVESKELGKITRPNLPFTLFGTPAKIHSDVAKIGEHTEGILKDGGLSEKEIDELKNAGII